MENIKKYLGGFILSIVTIDVTIVVWMMLAVVSGGDVPHIPFWDAQVRAVVALLP